MSKPFPLIRAVGISAVLATLSACSTSEMDWDLRRGGGLNTSGAALAATASRPNADDRGVLSYPGYQVAVARRGDTVGTVASRIGIGADELARYNAVRPDTALRAGEVLALPRRVSAAPTVGLGNGMGASGTAGNVIGSPIQTQSIDVATVASGAIEKAAPAAVKPTAAAPKPAGGPEPVQHRVKRGETAFIIARSYNVSARALADWNGLGPDMLVREGQFLMIPVAVSNQAAAVEPEVTAPGAGSPTPVPPSAKEPLPTQDEAAAATAKAAGTPKSPELGEQRTAASAAKFAMPVDGKIIRGYVKKKNDGIDIAAAAGTAVRAANDGTVAAITKDTDQVPILVIKHADGLLTVYAGIDAVTVAKGAKVTRGQTIAKVRSADPAFLHFEVRKGFESVDPMPYLQ